jgi:hypothetical protein
MAGSRRGAIDYSGDVRHRGEQSRGRTEVDVCQQQASCPKFVPTRASIRKNVMRKPNSSRMRSLVATVDVDDLLVEEVAFEQQHAVGGRVRGPCVDVGRGPHGRAASFQGVRGEHPLAGVGLDD